MKPQPYVVIVKGTVHETVHGPFKDKEEAQEFANTRVTGVYRILALFRVGSIGDPLY